MRETLPDGWAPTTLGQVVGKPRPKAAPSEHPDLPFVGMDSIAPGGMSLLRVGRFGDMKSAGGVFERGDVLYGRMRPYLNKVHLARERGACSAEFIVMPTSDRLDGGFLAYLLHQRSFVNFASAQSSGDRPRVDFESLAPFRFGLPPKREQQRIVSRIEELLSEIDEGERALERVQKLVERYRQSVLKAAVTGKLTSDWRDRNGRSAASTEDSARRVLDSRRNSWDQARNAELLKQSVYPVPARPVHGAEINVPATWAVVSVEAVTLAQRPIAYGVLQPGPDVEGGVSLVRVCDIADGQVDLASLKRVAPEVVAPFPRTRLQGGEVLVTIVGTIGRTGIVPKELSGANVARAVAVLSPQPAVRAEWLELCLREERMRQRMTETSREVARKTLNLEQLRECAIPVPPLDEQDEAISVVGSMLSRAAAVASDVDRQMFAVRALRQAILKAAFSGQLVPQDPTDEPASALLARLTVQPTDAPATERRRASRARSKSPAA